MNKPLPAFAFLAALVMLLPGAFSQVPPSVADSDGDGAHQQAEVDGGAAPWHATSTPMTDDDGDGTLNVFEPAYRGTAADPPYMCTGSLGVVALPLCEGYTLPAGHSTSAQDAFKLVHKDAAGVVWVWDSVCSPALTGDYAACKGSGNRGLASTPYAGDWTSDGYGWRRPAGHTAPVYAVCPNGSQDPDGDRIPTLHICMSTVTIADGTVTQGPAEPWQSVGDPDPEPNTAPSPGPLPVTPPNRVRGVPTGQPMPLLTTEFALEFNSVLVAVTPDGDLVVAPEPIYPAPFRLSVLFSDRAALGTAWEDGVVLRILDAAGRTVHSERGLPDWEPGDSTSEYLFHYYDIPLLDGATYALEYSTKSLRFTPVFADRTRDAVCSLRSCDPGEPGGPLPGDVPWPFCPGFPCDEEPVYDPCDLAPQAPVLCGPAPPTDPCEYAPSAPVACVPACESIPSDTPLVCGPAPKLCEDVDPGLPGTCGRHLPTACALAPNAPVLCTSAPKLCEDVDPGLPGTCGRHLPAVCELMPSLPGTCGRPLPPVKPCEGVLRNTPGFCGNPAPKPCTKCLRDFLDGGVHFTSASSGSQSNQDCASMAVYKDSAASEYLVFQYAASPDGQQYVTMEDYVMGRSYLKARLVDECAGWMAEPTLGMGYAWEGPNLAARGGAGFNVLWNARGIADSRNFKIAPTVYYGATAGAELSIERAELFGRRYNCDGTPWPAEVAAFLGGLADTSMWTKAVSVGLGLGLLGYDLFCSSTRWDPIESPAGGYNGGPANSAVDGRGVRVNKFKDPVDQQEYTGMVWVIPATDGRYFMKLHNHQEVLASFHGPSGDTALHRFFQVEEAQPSACIADRNGRCPTAESSA